MADLYLTDSGDLEVDGDGDLRMTDSVERDLSQKAYIVTMTALGEWGLYPQLGADLDRLIGRPNTPATADYGKQLIRSGLERHGLRNHASQVTIDAVPIRHDMIRFDIFITVGSKTQLALSVEQSLSFGNDTITASDSGLAIESGS